MSGNSTYLSNAEYDERKQFLDAIKTLVRSEQEEIFRILKRGGVEMSENSNGVFFDLARVSKEVFDQMKEFMEFCAKTRRDLAERDKKMEDSRLNLSQVNILD